MWAAHKAMEMKMAEVESCKLQEVAEVQERIGVLEKELDNANDLLSDPKRRGQRQGCLASFCLFSASVCM